MVFHARAAVEFSLSVEAGMMPQLSAILGEGEVADNDLLDLTVLRLEFNEGFRIESLQALVQCCELVVVFSLLVVERKRKKVEHLVSVHYYRSIDLM
jgi:hypothetical protein